MNACDTGWVTTEACCMQHTYPYLATEVPEKAQNHSQLAHEDLECAACAKHTPLMVEPVTEWDTEKHAKFPLRWTRTDAELPRDPWDRYTNKRKCRCKVPWECDCKPGPHARERNWVATVDHLFQRAAKFAREGKVYRVEYNLLEGGRDGLFIHSREIEPLFLPYDFDQGQWYSSDRTGPLRVITHVPPQDRCDWNLKELIEDRQFATDQRTIGELYYTGFHNRTIGMHRHSVAVPPYPSCFEASNLEFLTGKNEEKATGAMYGKPRLLGPWPCMGVTPGIIPATTVAIRASDGKARWAIDYGSPRSRHLDGSLGWRAPNAKTPGPLSTNAHIPLTDCEIFEEVEYATNKAFVRRIYIMQSIRAFCKDRILPDGLHVSTYDADQAAWFEQSPAARSCDRQCQVVGPRTSRCPRSGKCARGSLDTTNVTMNELRKWLSSTVFVDPRIAFGDRGAALITYYVMFQSVAASRATEHSERFCSWATDLDVRNCHYIPEDCKQPLRDWSAARTLAGEEPAWMEPTGFYDDYAMAAFNFYLPRAIIDLRKQWTRWNWDVSDGTRGRKLKVHTNMFPAPCLLLGETLNPLSQRIEVTDDKLERLTTLLDTILTAVDSHDNRTAPGKLAASFRGRINFMASSKPTMQGDVQLLHALAAAASWHAGMDYERPCHITKATAARLQALVHRAHCDPGASFFPRVGSLGKNGRAQIDIWSDASCDVDCITDDDGRKLSVQPYRGWGAMAHVRGTRTVFIVQMYVTPNARQTLRDSTAVEIHACTEARIIFAPLMQYAATYLATDTDQDGEVRGTCDAARMVDNESCVWVSTTGKANRAAERVLINQSFTAMDLTDHQSITATYHIMRHDNPETDLLSKCVVFRDTPEGHGAEPEAEAQLIIEVGQRFGPGMNIIWVPPPMESRKKLIPVLRAKETEEALAIRILQKARRKSAAARRKARRKATTYWPHVV